MVDEILTNTGIEYTETRFLYPPAGSYAVWFEDVATRGADGALLIRDHSVTIELYSKKVDKVTETKIEAEMDSLVIPYDKSDRQWLNDEKLFMVVYSFDYIEKRRVMNG
ncbi:hypothetical protein [Jeotgalibaca porci]|uniref:hypothetical protein n=1 Tax=Jeotgalibaca porci TaxID=1868793 RepID=UPI0035A1BB55